MFVTTDTAIREALRIAAAQRCASGRHTIGCEHRPITSPWVRRAYAGLLPASDRTGNIVTGNLSSKRVTIAS